MKDLERLKKKFKKSLKEVSKVISVSPSEITRNVYIRITVDLDIESRLNKEELNDLGGFRGARDELFPKVEEVKKGPKVLIWDIETAPIIARVWGLWNNNVGLNQIVEDWHLLSWAAKWLGAPENEVMYRDQSSYTDVKNDKKLLQKLWILLDEADIVITHNGKKFDQKKINARFVFHEMQPPSSYRHIDTLQIAKRTFGFTSNKLEYITDKLCKKYKKLKHSKFPGQTLWTECIAGNSEAWVEMEKYNIRDVLSLEELYLIFAAWDNSINFDVYGDSGTCKCGSTSFKYSGYHYTNMGKFQKTKCIECGFETRDAENLLDKFKRKSLARRITPQH